MSLMKKMKYGVTGFTLGALFFSGIALGATNKIEVSFDPVKFIVDNVDKTPANGKFNNNGSSVPSSIIYSGTTYVPLKLVGDMMGKPVGWDGKTKSILFGDSVAGGDYLTDKAPSAVAERAQMNQAMVIGGQTYTKGLWMNYNGWSHTGTQEYNLNGQYKTFNFSFATLDKARSGSSASIKIYGDGKEIWSSNALAGVPIQSESVSVSGVLKLSVEFTSEGYESYPAIVNPVLKK